MNTQPSIKPTIMMQAPAIISTIFDVLRALDESELLDLLRSVLRTTNRRRFGGANIAKALSVDELTVYGHHTLVMQVTLEFSHLGPFHSQAC